MTVSAIDTVVAATDPVDIEDVTVDDVIVLALAFVVLFPTAETIVDKMHIIQKAPDGDFLEVTSPKIPILNWRKTTLLFKKLTPRYTLKARKSERCGQRQLRL